MWKVILGATAALLVSAPAAGQETFRTFMLREDVGGVYSLECFQAGQKVMSATGLRIDHQQRREVGRTVFVDQDGGSINIVQSADLACIITQTGTFGRFDDLIPESSGQ